jgi:hypothetical protein
MFVIQKVFCVKRFLISRLIISEVFFKTGVKRTGSLPDIMFTTVQTGQLVYTTALVLIMLARITFIGNETRIITKRFQKAGLKIAFSKKHTIGHLLTRKSGLSSKQSKCY